jgi:hypothetical protein
MPKSSSTSLLRRNPGIVMVLSYFVVKGVSAAVIYLANMWFPAQVVLGTVSLTMWWAVMLSAGTLALITTLVMPFLSEIEHRRGRLLSPVEMMVIYLVVNFAGLWVITRFAEVFGLGVTSWMVVLALAAVLDFFQGIAMVALEKIRLSA